MFLYRADILSAFRFRDTDDIGSACHADTNILLPVRRVQAVDADDPLCGSVINFL